MKRLFVLAVLALATGCGGSSDATAPSTPDVVGTYSLQSVNGSSLPFTVAQIGSDTLQVISGNAVLNADHTYSESATEREDDAGTVSTTTTGSQGTYTQTNNSLTLTDGSDGTIATAAISGKTATLVTEGVTLVFQKN